MVITGFPSFYLQHPSMYIKYENVFLGIYMIYLSLLCECQLSGDLVFMGGTKFYPAYAESLRWNTLMDMISKLTIIQMLPSEPRILGGSAT